MQIANAVFLNSGQICIALKRIYVHKDIYGPFRDCFVKHVLSLKVGNGFEDGTFMGPIQNKLQYERVKEFLDDVQKQKQTVLTGGSTIETAKNGFFIQPTVIDNPADDSKVVVEEQFGPIVPLLQWSDIEEVIDRLNASDMGLGASVWTKNQSLGLRIGEDLEVGSLWLNEHLGIQPIATFGGHKKSGIGREWGVDGLRGYCNSQSLFLDRKQSTSPS